MNLKDDRIFVEMIGEYSDMLEVMQAYLHSDYPTRDDGDERWLCEFLTSMNAYGDQILRRIEFLNEHKLT